MDIFWTAMIGAGTVIGVVSLADWLFDSRPGGIHLLSSMITCTIVGGVVGSIVGLFVTIS